jgi:outer membrane biosynthesis protein TonB
VSMKTQKYILLLSSMMFSTQLGCSTHPEIKPFEAPTPQEIALENSENSQESIELPDSDDGFVEDAELPAEEPEQIAKVEPVETKKAEPAKVQAAKVKPAKAQKERVPASAAKNGYFVFASACDMKSSPSAGGKSVGNVAKGKKLWLDSHNAQWFKAYKKSGTAYIAADCVK